MDLRAPRCWQIRSCTRPVYAVGAVKFYRKPLADLYVSALQGAADDQREAGG
jgi:hypothetical protein